MLLGDNYYIIMSFSLIDSLAMNVLRTADGFYHVCFLMYFCHDFVLTDRTDAEMFLTFAPNSSVTATKFVSNTVVWRETGKTKPTPLYYQFPYDVMICYLHQSPTFHERYENGKKQAISRHYTEKQKLTPNYLHLCIRKKGERIKGKERERSQEIKTRGEKKEKRHSQVEDEACTFHQRIKVKDRILISTWGREGMSFGD